MSDPLTLSPGHIIDPLHHKHRHRHPKHRHPTKLPDYSWLEVYTEAPAQHLRFRARMGDENSGPIGITGGGAGWSSVQRPKKRALTVWRGPDTAFQYDIPLIFDGWKEARRVSDDIDTLEVMAGINQPGDPEPPRVILNANGALRHDAYHNPLNRWVIPTEPTWGTAIRSEDNGDLLRQFIVVSFMLFTSDDELARAKQVSSVRWTIARKGDTYNKIAARELHDVKFGNRLAKLNGARDGATKPKVGQEVKLPTTTQLAQWKKKSPRR